MFDDIENQLLTADGFEVAIIGYADDVGVPRAVYSYAKCCGVLMEKYDISYEEAAEHMEFNVACAYVGKKTPIFVRELPK